VTPKTIQSLSGIGREAFFSLFSYQTFDGQSWYFFLLFGTVATMFLFGNNYPNID
jgi:hypothetical protein